MVLRKVMRQSTTPVISFPKEYAHTLGLNFGDYVEVYLKDKKSLVIKPHKNPPKRITVDD